MGGNSVGSFLFVVDGFDFDGVMVERFVARVFKGGKVTIPVRVRDLLRVRDGDFVRLEVVEVMRGADLEARGDRRG